VTHNMQQVARVSDETAFLMVGDDRAGYLVKHGPRDERTEPCITGRFS
jgi:phosphate transport system ATP-binding protein